MHFPERSKVTCNLISFNKVATVVSLQLVDQTLSIQELYPLFIIEAKHICWETNFTKFFIELRLALPAYVALKELT